MTYKELRAKREQFFKDRWHYKMYYFAQFNYNYLDSIMYIRRSGRGENDTYNDVIIMADTETSKKPDINKYNSHLIGYEAGKTEPQYPQNHVVAWTISIRAFDTNICTIWGHKPSDMINTLSLICDSMAGDHTIIYFHNLAYDYVFLRKFMFAKWGYPIKALNTKPHYPIMLEFDNGMIFKDSLILSQRSIEKWAKDLDVEHKKAVGKWDYNKLRTQYTSLTEDEKQYIEYDTLAGVECIQKTMDALNKRIYSMPYTATGIPREECRKRGKEHNAHENFLQNVVTFDIQQKLELLFHGGFTHGFRDLINIRIDWDLTVPADFVSSYPFQMLTSKFPHEKFSPIGNCSIDFILNNASNYAFIFKLKMNMPRLKDRNIQMPVLQFSKCVKVLNPILDNGRILAADYVEIYLNELDLQIIAEQYTCPGNQIYATDVYTASKEYLPRWFTDYVYECFLNKCMLKGKDPVLYSIAKSKLNSLYGMCVQKPLRDDIVEDYLTGDYTTSCLTDEEAYEKYTKKYTSILPYQWGVWVTSGALLALFKLGKCCGTWAYSDTDSIYGLNWDMEKVEAYNQSCKDALKANGYEPVVLGDEEFYPGIAEIDGPYTEFKIMGAKRYCGRSSEDGKLHITVAGVPKKGVDVLNDNIDNFRPGFIFPGTQTGKNLHTYFYVDDIYIDDEGNETGDSIDLSPCDYLLDCVHSVDFDTILTSEIGAIEYEE